MIAVDQPPVPSLEPVEVTEKDHGPREGHVDGRFLSIGLVDHEVGWVPVWVEALQPIIQARQADNQSSH